MVFFPFCGTTVEEPVSLNKSVAALPPAESKNILFLPTDLKLPLGILSSLSYFIAVFGSPSLPASTLLTMVVPEKTSTVIKGLGI